jgi:hypothetical protein
MSAPAPLRTNGQWRTIEDTRPHRVLMPSSPLTGRGTDPASSTVPIPRAGTTLSARTLTWLAAHSDARDLASSVWITLTQLERAGQHPGTLAALRFVLIHHQPPTRTGHCPTCRRRTWRQWWRRRRFPCVVWRQIRGELRGHLARSSAVEFVSQGAHLPGNRLDASVGSGGRGSVTHLGGQLDPVGDPELAEHVGQVGCHGTAGDEQPVADLGVGEPLGGQPDDAELAGGQAVPARRCPARLP